MKSAINKHTLEMVDSNQDSQHSGDSLNYVDKGGERTTVESG